MPERHDALEGKLRLQRLVAYHFRNQLTDSEQERFELSSQHQQEFLPCGTAHGFLVSAGRQHLSS